MHAPLGLKQSGAGQRLEDLADGGQREVGRLRHVPRAEHGRRPVPLGEEGHQHDPVVGLACDSKHRLKIVRFVSTFQFWAASVKRRSKSLRRQISGL